MQLVDIISNCDVIMRCPRAIKSTSRDRAAAGIQSAVFGLARLP